MGGIERGLDYIWNMELYEVWVALTWMGVLFGPSLYGQGNFNHENLIDIINRLCAINIHIQVGMVFCMDKVYIECIDWIHPYNVFVTPIE